MPHVRDTGAATESSRISSRQELGGSSIIASKHVGRIATSLDTTLDTQSVTRDWDTSRGRVATPAKEDESGRRLKGHNEMPWPLQYTVNDHTTLSLCGVRLAVLRGRSRKAQGRHLQSRRCYAELGGPVPTGGRFTSVGKTCVRVPGAVSPCR